MIGAFLAPASSFGPGHFIQYGTNQLCIQICTAILLQIVALYYIPNEWTRQVPGDNLKVLLGLHAFTVIDGLCFQIPPDAAVPLAQLAPMTSPRSHRRTTGPLHSGTPLELESALLDIASGKHQFESMGSTPPGIRRRAHSHRRVAGVLKQSTTRSPVPWLECCLA